MNRTPHPNGPDDEVREALASAVRSYGPAVLGNAQMLGNILTDLLPDHPRERSLLVAAAEAEAATLLQEQVGQQRLDAGTAVALTARTLMERRALDPTAARWVTTAYATALGYNPPPAQAPPPPVDAVPSDAVPGAAVPGGAGPVAAGPGEPGDRTPYVPTQPMSSLPQPQAFSVPQPPGPSLPDAPTLIAPPGGSSLPPAPPGTPGHGSYGSPTPVFAPIPPGGSSVPSQGFGLPGSGDPGVPGAGGPPGGGYAGGYVGPGTPGAVPSPGYSPGTGGPGRRPTTLIVLASVVGVALVGYLALAGAAHLPPFRTAAAHHSPPPSPSTAPPSPSPTTEAPSPSPTGPVLASGVTPLMDILSSSLPDPATQCQPRTPSGDTFTAVGLVSSYYCTDTNLPGGGIWAYQTDTQADYDTTWVNYNKWWGFSASSAGSSCPPSGSGGGLNGWHDDPAGYPDRTGQVLECQMVGSNGKNDQPSYTWSLPTQNAFIVAAAVKGSTWSALNNWWARYAPPQSTAAPSPTSS